MSEDKKNLYQRFLSKYREYKINNSIVLNQKKCNIIQKQREVDNLTGENTAKIKKHCNCVNMNIASINQVQCQNDLNVNATVWSSQAPDKVNVAECLILNQASITPCTKI